ncbi:MAG: hypothetical protein EOL88_06165 [Bacteroidia bacterium]|nr:hypothetical protein [Bacteroidia bacterium]
MERVINMTPHDINVLDDHGEIIRTYKVSGKQIRLASDLVKDVPLEDGTPTVKTIFGDPEGLPEFQEGVFFIVSQMIKNALPSRTDLLVPAEVVRDGAGAIIGCKSLSR